jgi:transposase-like protein
VQAMGLSGASKSQVSKLCKDIDEWVQCLSRPTDRRRMAVSWFHAIYLKVRDGGRIISVAAIIAVAVKSENRREIIGLGIGPSEAERFWAFSEGMVKRDLKGVVGRAKSR